MTLFSSHESLLVLLNGTPTTSLQAHESGFDLSYLLSEATQ